MEGPMIYRDAKRGCRLAALCSAAVLLGTRGTGLAQEICIPADGTAYPATVTTRDLRISMSDGIKLTADVTFPAGSDGKAIAGQFPVVLTQTPYNKNGISFAAGSLVEHGYVQVVVETRGTGSSEGVWDSFGTREQLDGAELVEWAASQPWSTGDVVLHGTSYGAINQLFTAAAYERAHPGSATVKALFPIVPASDTFRDIAVIGDVKAPTFIIGGWFDLFQRGEPLLFQKLREEGVETKLMMGPWYHITAGQGLPADGVPAPGELELRWFNQHVCGGSDAVLAALADVNYYQIGEGHFHPASDWPPAGVSYAQQFLSG